MAVSDNYVIAGASGDNLDCEATDGWTAGGNANDPTQSSNAIQGSYSLGLQTSDTGDCYWYHDVSAGSRFKITEVDLSMWFFYIKGKSDHYLVNDSSAVVMRLYFGGTSKYADYRLTEAGNLSLDFGWNYLVCSGRELNGGGTSSGLTDDDYNLDVYRIEFHLNVANKVDHDLNLDAITIGNEVVISEGDSTNPYTIEQLSDYVMNGRSYPLQIVTTKNQLANINTSLKLDNAYMKIANKYIYFDQESAEVKHNLTLTNSSNFVAGELENENAVKGCIIAKPTGKTADILVDSSSNLQLFSSNLLGFNNVTINGNFTGDTVTLVKCGTLNINNNVNLQHSIIHDATNNVAVILANASGITDMLIYNASNGLEVLDDSQIAELKIYDTDNYDVIIADGKTFEVTNSVINKIKGA
jgi:hypothetical protein